MQVQTDQKRQVLSPKQMIEALRAEAARSQVFNAVCHIFAIRERARQQVTLGRLRIRMAQEGYNYSRNDYEQVLRFLASIGIGVLDFDSKKNLRSLVAIKTTLQSIGAAAVGKGDSLERFTPAAEFSDLPVKAPSAPSVSTPAPMKPLVSEEYPVSLTIIVEGLKMSFNLPKGLTMKELSKLLSDVYKSKGEV